MIRFGLPAQLRREPEVHREGLEVSRTVTAQPSEPGSPHLPAPVPVPAPHSRGGLPRVALGVMLLSIAPLGAVRAQEFGRWWWEGLASVGKRSYEIRNDGQTTKSDLTDLRLAGAMNGYLFHPAVGDFRVGLDLLTSKNDSGTSLDTHRVGFDTRLNFLPKGAYPLQLFVNRQFYDYSGSALDDPLMSLRVPEESREWGGRFRVRKGAFRGLFLGFNNVQTVMEGTTADDVYNRQFLDWSRGGKKFHHRFSINRLFRDYYTPSYALEDISVNFDERANLGQNLLWEMFATAVRRDRSLENQRLLLLDNYRLRTRLRQRFHRGDYLEFTARVSRLLPDTAPSSDIQSYSTLYRKPIGRGWEIGPFGQFTRQSSQGLTLSSPRLGLSVLWNHQRALFDALIAGFVSHGSLALRDTTESRQESRASMRLTGTLAHGASTGLRKEFEFELGRYQLTFDRDPIEGAPAVILPQHGLETDNFYRARFVLLHQWDQRHLSGWIQWRRSDGIDVSASESVVADSTTGALQYGSSKYTLLANIGRASTENGSLIQRVDYRLLRLVWRPSRYLSVRGVYRYDVRQVAFSPNSDGLRVEAGVVLHIGLIDVESFASKLTETIDGTGDRSRTQFNLFIARRFAGWLPVITGTQRRGVIR